MRPLLILIVTLCLALPARGESDYRVENTAAGDRVVIETLEVDATVAALWAAYTTADGWTAWASPEAEIDLRVGGRIRTHYTAGSAIGDEGTNTLHIVNYVPHAVLTLRAELGPTWPALLRADADRLSNVITFHELPDGRARVVSYGIGYRDTDEYDQLLAFFRSANARLYTNLKRYVEDGVRVEW